MMNWATNEQILLLKADFCYAEPEHIKFYPHLFNCEHKFNQPKTKIYFSRSYLRKNIYKNKYDLPALMQTFPLQLFLRPGQIQSISDQVSSIVFKRLINEKHTPKLSAVAKILNTTEQTLRRKLNNENRSYQQIKDGIRCAIAKDRLLNTDATIASIAEDIGFQEPHNFIRAFKKWFQINPAQYRSKYKNN